MKLEMVPTLEKYISNLPKFGKSMFTAALDGVMFDEIGDFKFYSPGEYLCNVMNTKSRNPDSDSIISIMESIQRDPRMRKLQDDYKRFKDKLTAYEKAQMKIAEISMIYG